VKATIILGAIVLAVLFLPDAAHAAAGGGGALPWDAPITALKQDLTGNLAFSIGLIAMFAAGAALLFAREEMTGFVRVMVFLVLLVAFLVNVQNVASALGIAGAVVS
jgi:type IV secretory pathway VirB2 component (pilin)